MYKPPHSYPALKRVFVNTMNLTMAISSEEIVEVRETSVNNCPNGLFPRFHTGARFDTKNYRTCIESVSPDCGFLAWEVQQDGGRLSSGGFCGLRT